MTIQQEATNLIYNLPDESVRAVVDIMKKMLPYTSKNAPETSVSVRTADVSKRIGMGKAILNDPNGFDDWDAEIASLFEGNDR